MSACDNLQRQVAELEALQAMFPEEGTLELSAIEQQLYETAKLLIDTSDSDIIHQALSGTIRVPNVELNGSPVKLRFVLGHRYPETPARLTVECDGPRSDHDALMAALSECQEQCGGSEALLLAVDTLKDAVEQLQQGRAAAADAADAPQAAGAAQPPARACAVVWFHHIKSLEKRKFIVARARELGIRGYSKPGFPGIIVAEGPEEALEEYIGNVRGLRWQAMQVRARERLAGAGGSAAEHGGSCFSQAFSELEESGMSELSQHCSAAGVEHLFLAALKISK